MKKLSLAFGAIISVLLIGTSVSAAPPLPRGSYRATCSNIIAKGNTLFATCRNVRGQPVRTSLARVHQCRRDIANINGTLVCR